MTGNNNPAVSVAKARTSPLTDEPFTLSTGDRVKLHPVSASLIDEVTSSVLDPEVPYKEEFDETKGKKVRIENPFDPAYEKALQRAERERGIAAIDAMVLFGVELVDGLPEDEQWITRLKFLEKRGKIKLDEYDLNDPFEKEFVYKRFIAVTTDVIEKISSLSQMNPAEVERVENSFPGDEKRGEHKGSKA